MERYSPSVSYAGASGFDYIQKSRVLVVGAGGIGCEVLKNLVMSGFKTIEIVDLDIIDVSNLNRQFLFRREHVNKPKSTVAAETALQFNPDVSITAYHKNVKDPEFNVAFFSKFNIVLNALDNVDARRHVNRLCLAANVVLIESGTTGYIGQVMPIIKGETECYECRPKVTQKVYPICTIRSTPDKPVHCIVWAKELFKLIFGSTSESMLYEDMNTVEESTYMSHVALPQSGDIAALIEHARILLEAVFHLEVRKQIDMGVYKSSKRVPEPVPVETITHGCDYARMVLEGSKPRPSNKKGWDRALWTNSECITELVACMYEAISTTESRELLGSYVFEKDNKFIMSFVTAASNLRSRVFDIEPMSFHDAKGVAGNIIPAIASTNAIIAGVQVAQAMHILSQMSADVALKRNSCPTTYCQRMPTRRGHYLCPSSTSEPQEDCYVCNTSQQTLEIDTEKSTLDTLVSSVVKRRLGLVEPSVMIGASVIYEEGDEMDETLTAHLSCTLSQCPGGGIVDGTIVTLEDFRQDLSISLVVRHVAGEELDEEEYPEGFRLMGASQAKARVRNSSTSTATGNKESADDDDGVCEVIDDQVEVIDAKGHNLSDGNNITGKRPRSEIDSKADLPAPKK
mmetsp:Transcript_23168/g.33967  ORF Transcript_23168/g.33967 Transcript_23168/m.33967 type:complete len:628 (-) Transcript_23168:232-2115(-)